MLAPTYDALLRQWDALDTCPLTREIVARWCRDCAALSPAVGEICQLPQAVDADPDAALYFLVERVQAGADDAELAGVVVLHQMAPAVLRRQHHRLSLDDLLSQLWTTIACYPLDRRPTKVAANLIIDAAHGGPTRDVPEYPCQMLAADVDAITRSGGAPVNFSTVDQIREDPDEVDWTAERVIRAAVRLELITEDTAEILIAVSGSQRRSKRQVAAARGWDYDSVRQRYSRAVRTIASIGPDRLAAAA